MRFIRYLILAVIAVCLITVAMANREPVTLNLVPEPLGSMFLIGESVTLPLFVVILGAVVVGLLLGFVWEWIRESRLRAEAARDRREKEKLAREVSRMKAKNPAASDDVLAILDDSGARAG